MAESTVSLNSQEGGSALKGLGCAWLGHLHWETGNHGVTESFRLEKTLEIIESNCLRRQEGLIMTLSKLQPIQDIRCSELGPKPTFREPEVSWKPQHLESQPSSWGGWKQHIPTHSSNPHSPFFPSTTKCEAGKFLHLISHIFSGHYRSYRHFLTWHPDLWQCNYSFFLTGKASLMCKALQTRTAWTHRVSNATEPVGLSVLQQGFPPLLPLATSKLTLQERSAHPFSSI